MSAGLGRLVQGHAMLDEARMQRSAERQYVVIEIVSRVVQEAASFATLTQAQVGARLDLQHEGKIFGPHAGVHLAVDMLMANELLRHFGGKTCFGGCIDGGGIDAFVVHMDRSAQTQGDARTDFVQPLLHQVLHLRAEAAHCADQRGLAWHDAEEQPLQQAIDPQASMDIRLYHSGTAPKGNFVLL